MSGMMVGQALKRQLIDSMPEEQAAAAYGNWLGDWFAHDRLELQRLYARHPVPPQWCQEQAGASAAWAKDVYAIHLRSGRAKCQSVACS